MNILRLTLAALTIISQTTAFSILDYNPECDNYLKVGVCRNYIVYGLIDAASLYFCINGQINPTDLMSVQNIINLNQNEVTHTNHPFNPTDKPKRRQMGRVPQIPKRRTGPIHKLHKRKWNGLFI
jgi:hypothetical protein